jgi:two-component system sensor histidine kinase DesK
MMTSLKSLFTTKKPWLDLVYLGCFFLAWFVDPPNTTEIALSVGALAGFVALYVFTMRRMDWTVLVAAGLAVCLGLSMAAMNYGSAVFIVFAAPMIARLPDTRLRVPALIVLGPAVLLGSVLIGAPWYFTLAVVVLSALSGLTASSAARRAESELEAEDRQARAAAAAVEAERSRISKDLHDLLGHSLSVISLKADLAARLFEQKPDMARQEIEAIQAISREALGEVRDAVSGLRDRSLQGELKSVITALESAEIEVIVQGELPALNAEPEVALVMVLREASTNILRHAQASRVEIAFVREAGRHRISIRDNGRGGRPAEGNGLSGMRERVEAVDGLFELSVEGGFAVRVSLPEQLS